MGWTLYTKDGAEKVSRFDPTPVGTIQMYPAAAAPANWALCQGQAISRSFSALFALIGTTYGAGDGSTTFNLPDFQGRVPVGLSGAGGHSDVTTLGNNDGAVLANRRPKHSHSLGSLAFVGTLGTTSGGSAHSHGIGSYIFTGTAGNTGAGTAHNHGITDPNHSHTQQTNPNGATPGSTGRVGVSLNDGGTGPQSQPPATGSSSTGITINNESAHTHPVTPAGTLSGTSATESAHTHTYTPAGTFTGSVGTTATAPVETPSYLVINYIIKVS